MIPGHGMIDKRHANQKADGLGKYYASANGIRGVVVAKKFRHDGAQNDGRGP